MVMEKKTGIIVSFDTSGKSEIQSAIRRLSDSIDAIYLKLPVLLRESASVISEIKSFMRKNNSEKPLIIDYRLDQSELDSLPALSNLFENEGAFGMTVMAVYGKDFLRFCTKKARIGIFAIIDVGTPFFRELFDDTQVVQNAILARDNRCEGIVMTSRHLDRIRKVKETIGNDLQLLSTIEKRGKVGDAISSGADFEIVSCELLEQ